MFIDLPSITDIKWQKQDFRNPDLYWIFVTIVVLTCCSVTKLCLTLCDPMDCSAPGSSVLHFLPEFTQTYVHWVSNAI